MNTSTSLGGRAKASLLSPLNVWGLSLGCAVGWGAFMVPANLFIPTAGPVGTMIAMAISTLLLLVIGANFCYLAEKYQDNGGIVAYTRNILGHDHAFLAAWILIIAYLSILWANATANVLLARFLLGDIFSWGYLYTIADFDIYFGEVAATWLVIVAFGLFSAYGGSLKKHLNTLFAVVFFLSVVLLFAALLKESGTQGFAPPFQLYTSPVMQVFSMVMLAPWMFFGFEAVTHACDDFAFPSRKLFPIIAAAVLAGGIIYVLLAAMAVMAVPQEYPSWIAYMAARPGLEGLVGLPVFHSVYMAFGTEGLAFLCLSIATAIMTSLLGLYRTTAYLLQFMGRGEILPPWFARCAADETPRNAIIFVMLVSLFIPLLGRVSIVWLCDVITVVGSVAYGYASVCAYKTAAQEGNSLRKNLGLIGLGISVLFFFCPMIPGLLLGGSLATESYLMLSVWSILGFAYYWYAFKTDLHNRFGHSTTMCIMILFLNFFSTSLWLRQVMAKEIGLAVNGSENITYSSIASNIVVQLVMISIVLLLMADIFITLKRRERKMVAARMQQHKINEAKNIFLGNLSHDLRIPMEAAQTSVHQALENCSVCAVCTEDSCPQRVPDRLSNALGQLDVHSQHLLELIGKMLDNKSIELGGGKGNNSETGGIEMGKIRLDLAPVDLRHTFQRIKDIFALQMQEKNIFFEVYPIDLPHPLVVTDNVRLERLLINLVSNACEFTPAGGGVMVTLLETKPGTVSRQGSEMPGAVYEIHIHDTGATMPPAIVSHLSEPFDPEVSGLGGLYIAKGLAFLLGGRISVAASQGQGKELIVTLPLPWSLSQTDSETDAAK